MSLQPPTEHEQQVYAQFRSLSKRDTLLRDQVKVSHPLNLHSLTTMTFYDNRNANFSTLEILRYLKPPTTLLLATQKRGRNTP